MYERLTYHYGENNEHADFITIKKDGYARYRASCEGALKLAAYEDSGLSPEEVQGLAKAKADGRMVVLPCKVGDTVYEPFAGKVYEKTVDRIIINRFTTPQIWIETKLPFATPRLERWDMAFGKTVFLTREAAEKALGVGE